MAPQSTVATNGTSTHGGGAAAHGRDGSGTSCQGLRLLGSQITVDVTQAEQRTEDPPDSKPQKQKEGTSVALPHEWQWLCHLFQWKSHRPELTPLKTQAAQGGEGIVQWPRVGR